MHAETVALDLGAVLTVVIIQPRLSDCHYRRGCDQSQKLVLVDRSGIGAGAGMDTDGGRNLGVGSGVRQDLGDVVAIHCNGEHVADTRLGSTLQHVGDVHAVARILEIIEVTVAVYQHG